MYSLRNTCPYIDEYSRFQENVPSYVALVNSSNIGIVRGIFKCLDNVSDWADVAFSTNYLNYYFSEILSYYIVDRHAHGEFNIETLRLILSQTYDSRYYELREKALNVLVLIARDAEYDDDKVTLEKVEDIMNSISRGPISTRPLVIYATKNILDMFRRARKDEDSIVSLVGISARDVGNKTRVSRWISYFSEEDLEKYLNSNNYGGNIHPYMIKQIDERIEIEKIVAIFSKEESIYTYAYTILNSVLHSNV